MERFTEGFVEETNSGESTVNQKPVLPPDVNKEEKELYDMLLAGFGKDERVAEVTNDEWKKMNASEHVVTYSEHMLVDTEATMANQDKEELMASLKAGRILTGKIVRIKSANKDKAIATHLAEVQFGNDSFRIFIPSYLLYLYNVKSKTTKNDELSVQKVLIDMIGAEVNFIVKFVDLSKKIAYASRLDAMQKIGRENYIKKTSTGRPRVGRGSIVEARIIAVKKHSIVLDVLGSETCISAVTSKNELSWSRIEDCRTVFRVNDMIPVRILGIEERVVKKHNEQYKLIFTVVSHRQTTQDPMEKYWDSIDEGDPGRAVVTGIYNGNVFLSFMNRVEILCKAPQHGDMPYIGMECTVKITKKQIGEDGTKRIFGVFIY